MTREQEETIVLTCQRRIIEAESTIKVVKELQRALLERLRDAGIDEDFDLYEFINTVVPAIMMNIKTANDALEKFRDLDLKPDALQ